jgi:4-amino-4-deoxy-L-arabinose transferase-like glycosyltransferase
MWMRAGLLALCLATFVAGIGRSAIQDADEAYYAEAGREMVAGGDWITPHYNFEPRLQKPVFFYWLVAGTYRVAGVSEWGARLWAALAGAGLAFLAFAIGRRWIDAQVGWLAGVIVATSFGLVPLARQSLPDVPLAFFITLTIWAGIEALADAPADGALVRRGPWLLVSAVAMALGTLTKGPVAIALPGLVFAVLLARQWLGARRDGRRFELRPSFGWWIAALVVFLVVAVPWYVAVTRAQGIGYLQQFFVGENVDRFATARYNSWRGWRYVPIVIGGLLPWSVFGVFWIRPLRDIVARRRRLPAVDVRLLAWAFAPLGFFFVSVGSQPRYIVPCLVPLAVLLARTIAGHARGRGWVFPAAGAVGGALIVVFGILLVRARPLLEAAGGGLAWMGALAIVGAGAIVIAAAGFAPRRLLVPIMAICAAAALVLFDRTVAVSARPAPVEVVGAIVRAHPDVSAACACGAFGRSLNFYTHVKTVFAYDTERTDADVVAFLRRPEPALAAVDAALLPGVERTLGRPLTRLVEVDYLDTSIWQRPGDALLAPDPSLVRHVVLVSNR